MATQSINIRGDLPALFIKAYQTMKKSTKISIFFILVFLISTVYAFAAFIDHQVIPLSEPVKLLITGVTLIAAGQFIKNHTQK